MDDRKIMNSNLKNIYIALCSNRIYSREITQLANRTEIRYIHHNDPMCMDVYIRKTQIFAMPALDLYKCI